MTKAHLPDRTSRRDLVMRELGRHMRLISEEAACSSWAWRIEDELPAVLHEAAASGQPGYYRGVELSPVYAAWLTTLAAELGHWVIPGPGREYLPYTPRSHPADLRGPDPAAAPGDAEPAA